MNLQYNNYASYIVTLFFLCTIGAFSIDAQAAKKESSAPPEASVYIVQDGDFLGNIAIAHQTTIAQLIEVNNLENPDKIYGGMKLIIPLAKRQAANERSSKRPIKKKKVIIEVPKGFTLSRISKTYGVSIAKIVRANEKLNNPDMLQAGMKILIPGATKEIELVPPPPCFKPAVEFYRVRTDETEKIHLSFCNGKTNPSGVEALSQFSFPVTLKKMPFPLHRRLATLLQKVSEKYPGKRIEIISGQRVKKDESHESFHSKGQAIDFRVAGIANRKLVNFLRTFNNTGVGYYPNSVFIHLDTRKRNAFWIDYSRPGERAIYAKAGMKKGDIEKIRLARLEKKSSRKAKNALKKVAAQKTTTASRKATASDRDTLVSSPAPQEQRKNTTADSIPVQQKQDNEVASVATPGQA